MHAVIIIALGSKPIGAGGVGFGTTKRWIQTVIGWENDCERIKRREAELGSALSCSKRNCVCGGARETGQFPSPGLYMSLSSLWGCSSQRRRDGTKNIYCTSHRSSYQEDTHLLMLLGCMSGAFFFFFSFNPLQPLQKQSNKLPSPLPQVLE